MNDVRTTADLRAEGLGSEELARKVRAAELVHLRRGAYADPGSLQDAEARHRALVLATVPLLAPGAVVSHVSAAILHGLPLLDAPRARVQITRADARGGKNRGGVHLHAAPLEETEVVPVEGVATTTLARTVLDLARSLSREAAVVSGDAALRRGLDRDELDALLAGAGRRPRIARARAVAGLLDGRSESPGESLSRLLLAGAGLAPELQHEVRDAGGAFVARCDFAWPEHRTVGEFDGKIKYGRLLAPGTTSEEIVYREKLREDKLRDLGWQVVRWVWRDLERPERVVERLVRAFARAGFPL